MTGVQTCALPISTVGGFVTNNGKTFIDFETNVGNTYIIEWNSTVYLPPASEHEDLEINVIFGKNSILCCEVGLFVSEFTLSDISSEPVMHMTSYSRWKSGTTLQSITIRSIRNEDDTPIWVVVNQRGVFNVSSLVGKYIWMLFPDGRLNKSST